MAFARFGSKRIAICGLWAWIDDSCRKQRSIRGFPGERAKRKRNLIPAWPLKFRNAGRQSPNPWTVRKNIKSWPEGSGKNNAMSGTLINLILQLIAGAIGGNAAGGLAKNVSLGGAGNTVAGAVGGVAGGSLLSSLIPMLSGGAGGLDISAMAGQFVGGGVSGAIVTAIVGMIMNNMKKA
jgi:hypothetical protein